MSLTPRRTLRIPDNEWNAGHAKARGEGDSLTNVLRRLLAGYLAGHQVKYQATSKRTVNGAAQVIRGLEGPLGEIERLYRPSQWTIEEYDVSPPRPVNRRRSA